jgi:hypothetical protein
MERLMGVVCAVVIAGCNEGHKVGQLELTWSLTLDGVPASCDAVGAARVELTADRVLPDGGIADPVTAGWPCDASTGITGELDADSYSLVVAILDVGGEVLQSETVPAASVIAFEVRHLGVFTFAFDGEPVPEDCDVTGDEDGDGDADCADTDCETDPACEEPPLCAPAVTIAIVYDGGGQGGATYNQNFVVLENRNGAPYDLSGHSLQTSGIFLASWEKFDLPAESIPANGSYLIALGMAGSQGAPLPPPDEAYTTGFLSTVQLVVALMPDTTLLTDCPTTPIDLLSADQAACAEGTTVPAPGTDDPTEWYARGDAGCADTDVNSADFAVATAGTPPNSASPAVACTCP